MEGNPGFQKEGSMVPAAGKIIRIAIALLVMIGAEENIRSG